jgi:hypothetical protein
MAQIFTVDSLLAIVPGVIELPSLVLFLMILIVFLYLVYMLVGFHSQPEPQGRAVLLLIIVISFLLVLNRARGLI